MLRQVRLFSFVVLLLLLAAGAFAAPFQLDYTLAPKPPKEGQAAQVQVTLRISGTKDEKQLRVQMPVWSPGDYHVMNHAKYVQNLVARAPGGAALPVEHPDQNTWQVAPGESDAVEITYSLPNTPPGFFSENVRVSEKYAFFNGPATYFYVVGHKTDPATLHVELPEGWKRAFTPLEPRKGENLSVSTFAAPDYDTLADSPVVAGDFVTREFKAVDRPHTVVFFDAHEGMDYDSFTPVLEKIVVEENRLMGGPPYARYAFFFDVGGRGGGLEHLNSCRIACGREVEPRFLASMAAHEFFHLWNVKRIRPEVLGPFDYVTPPKTHNLWFSEGVTSYYGDLSALRAGLSTQTQYLRGLSRSIAGFLANPNRLKVSADESSYRVWEANNSSGYGGISYYHKGELIGLCLDLRLRAVTGGKSSLDDVMRDMMSRYGLPEPGFPEDGIRDAVIRAGGEAMGPFYDLLARSTEEVPFEGCLAAVGLRLSRSAAGGISITTDATASPEAQALRKAWLSGRP